jgi:hypothetical protein
MLISNCCGSSTTTVTPAQLKEFEEIAKIFFAGF